MLRFGKISDIDAAKGKVRVKFDEDGIVSDWLPLAFPSTSRAKFSMVPDKGEAVACAMDENCESGAVIGTIYNNSNQPAGSTENKYVIDFGNGDKFEYDKQSRRFEMKVGNNSFRQDQTGFRMTNGSDSLGQCLMDLIDQIMLETHTETGTVTTVPINNPAYAAIKARIQTFIS
jgi:phage baseplate assembly protein V